MSILSERVRKITSMSTTTARRGTWWRKFLFCGFVLIQTGIVCVLVVSGILQSFLRCKFPAYVGYSINTSRSYIRTFPNSQHHNPSPNDGKRILLWTGYFDKEPIDWAVKIAKGLFTCPRKCSVSVDKNMVSDSDAVVFHLNNIWKTPMPTSRRPDQVWILVNHEPLSMSYVHGWESTLTSQHKFNWTFWYRRDATIYAPYASFEPKTPSFHRNISDDQWKPSEPKSRLVSMLSSNCIPDSRRYRMADELSRYVDIDMYGACGDKSCPRNNSHCQDTLRKYRFHLAFENSFCRDYITEKFYDALKRGQIPVVNWKYKENRDLVPARSYINVFDFPDLKSVAEHLIRVSQNESLYNSYFEWRRHYELTCAEPVISPCYWCKVCDALHESPVTSQEVGDLKSWIKDDICLLATVCMKTPSTFCYLHLLKSKSN